VIKSFAVNMQQRRFEIFEAIAIDSEFMAEGECLGFDAQIGRQAENIIARNCY